MNLTDDVLQFLQDFVPRIRRQSASYLDLVGQSPNATATTTGQLGEYLSTTLASGSAIGLTNNTAADIATISLSPGDWDVWINAHFSGNVATTAGYLQASISATSATIDKTPGMYGEFSPGGTTVFAGGATPAFIAGPARISLASTKTYYFVALAGFAVSTAAAFGIIQARRCRHYPG